MSVLRGPGWAIPPDFWLAPAWCPPSFVLNFTFKFVWLTYTADNFPASKILNNLKTFWRQFWRYSQANVGFDRFNHSKSIFITTENHHAGETFMLSPLLFSLAPQWPPQFFHSRLATGNILNLRSLCVFVWLNRYYFTRCGQHSGLGLVRVAVGRWAW